MAQRADRTKNAQNAPLTTLLPILRQQVCPWVDDLENRGLLVAQPTLAQFRQWHKGYPHEVRASPRKMAGPRKAVKGRPASGHTNRATARWPADHLITTRIPILLCALRGQVDFRMSDYSLHLPPGHFCLLPADVPRTDGSQSHLESAPRDDDECDLMWLRPDQFGFDCWICHSRGKAHWGGNIGERVYINEPEAMAHFAAIEHEASQRAEGWLAACRYRLALLLLSAQREIASGQVYGPVQQVPGETVSRDWDPIGHTRRYIEANLKDKITLDQAAQASRLSRTQFIARFRRETGDSFIGFVTRRRLERARSLLRDTNWPIIEVAFMVGLRPSHLRELFRTHEDMSPREYRQRAQSGKG